MALLSGSQESINMSRRNEYCRMTLNQVNAVEHLLKTLDGFGLMPPYLVLFELNPEGEGAAAAYRVLIKVVGQKELYVIEIEEEEEV